MRISAGVEWAIHCATVLAVIPDEMTMPGLKLAEFHGVPAPYLAKSLQALSRAGIVESVPGRHGGYRLAKASGDITLLDVVLAVEGDEPAFRCTEIRRRGPSRVAARCYRPVCGIAGAMWRAEQAWRDELAATTIADLVVEVAESAPPEALTKSALWIQEVLR